MPQTPQMVGDTLPQLVSVKLHFEYVMKTITECLRLHEIGVDFWQFSNNFLQWDTPSTSCLRNIQNLLIEFLRKLHFENVMEMVTECLRLQEIDVRF